MNYYEIGQRIRKVRKAKRLSQEQLAEQVGISTTHMSHIETGNTKLSIEVFAEICRALECRADEILFCVREIQTEQAVSDIVCTLSDCSPSELCFMADITASVYSALKKYNK